MPVNQMSGIHLEAAAVPVRCSPSPPSRTTSDLTSRRYTSCRWCSTRPIDHMRAGDGRRPDAAQDPAREGAWRRRDGIAARRRRSPRSRSRSRSSPRRSRRRSRSACARADARAIANDRPAGVRAVRRVRRKRTTCPQGRTEPGMWSLPDGEARYAARRQAVDDDRPHARSRSTRSACDEVARIEGEMLQIAKKLGYKRPQEPERRHREEPQAARHHRASRSSTLYQKYIDQMYAKLPQLFGRLPKAKVEVDADRGVPREGGRRRAEYQQPARRTARARAACRSTPAIPTKRKTHHHGVDRLSRGRARPSHADLDRAGARRRCRRSASRAATPPTSRAGRSTPSGSARRSASTRIPTATTAACRTRCCAPSAWWSTPASTTSTGRATRWWSSSTTIRRSTRSRCRARPTATSSGRARRSAYKIGQLKILELREKAKKALGDQVRHPRVPRRGPRRRRPAAGRARSTRAPLDRADQGPTKSVSGVAFAVGTPTRGDDEPWGPSLCRRLRPQDHWGKLPAHRLHLALRGE